MWRVPCSFVLVCTLIVQSCGGFGLHGAKRLNYICPHAVNLPSIKHYWTAWWQTLTRNNFASICSWAKDCRVGGSPSAYSSRKGGDGEGLGSRPSQSRSPQGRTAPGTNFPVSSTLSPLKTRNHPGWASWWCSRWKHNWDRPEPYLPPQWRFLASPLRPQTARREPFCRWSRWVPRRTCRMEQFHA